jgi:hypothetical protein
VVAGHRHAAARWTEGGGSAGRATANPSERDDEREGRADPRVGAHGEALASGREQLLLGWLGEHQGDRARDEAIV